MLSLPTPARHFSSAVLLLCHDMQEVSAAEQMVYDAVADGRAGEGWMSSAASFEFAEGTPKALPVT